MFIDSHCHIDTIDLSAEFDGNIDLLMKQIEQAQVQHLLCVCIELKDLPNIQQLAEKYDNISYSVGTHPNVILESEPSDQTLISLAKAGFTLVMVIKVKHINKKLTIIDVTIISIPKKKSPAK